MTNAVIVSTARTPLTKSWKGAFNMTYGPTLGAHAVQHAVQRAQRGAVGHVEGTLPALGEWRAGGGNDDGVGHGNSLISGGIS